MSTIDDGWSRRRRAHWGNDGADDQDDIDDHRSSLRARGPLSAMRPQRHASGPAARIRGADVGLLLAYLSGALFLTMVLLNTFLFGSDTTAAASVQGSALHQLGIVAAFVLAALTTLLPGGSPRMLVLPWLLVIAMLYCWASVLWSIDPGITVRRMGLTTLVIWTASLLARRMGNDRLLDTMRYAFFATLILNYIALIGFPEVGIQQGDLIGDSGAVDTWRGVFIDKNACGPFCALTLLLFIFDARRVAWWFRGIAIVLAAIFLAGTHSKTSIGVVAAAIAVGMGLRLYSPRFRLFCLPAVLLLIAGLAAAWGRLRDRFEAALNDPSAFTGRGQIWKVLTEYIHDHWWLGSGYGALWGIGPQSPINSYTTGWITQIYVGHSFYLDTAAQIGVPGVLLLIVATLIVPFGKLLTSFRIWPARRALCGSIILFCGAHGFNETGIFNRDAVENAVLMIAITLIAVAEATQQDERMLAASRMRRFDWSRPGGAAVLPD
jgi:exopolysaccharide production protein ExoQ